MRDAETNALLAAALAAKAIRKAQDALDRAPVPGPQGSRGERGPAGRDGVAGPAGEQGEQGEVGPAGPQGERGPAGPIGERGPHGQPGKQGERGEIGPAGPQGPPGIDGERGATGPMGDRGRAGSDGRDAVTLLPARAVFTRDAANRTSRLVIMSVVGGHEFQIIPVRGNDGLMIAADINFSAAPDGA